MRLGPICLGLSMVGLLLAPLPTLAPAAPGTSSPAPAAPAAAAAEEKLGKFSHVEFNVARRQVRVECEALAVDAPLEFFCCRAGTSEHEAVLRTPAKPSDIHTAMLAIGVKPGEPLTYVESTKKWIPPHGPPLHIEVEYQKDGKTVRYPAYRWIRDIKTKKEPKAFTWVFSGSRVMESGAYAADDTGYVVSLVNFDYSMIDVPELASSSNETLEWERNADLMPKKGTQVWMIIEPAGGGGAATRPSTQPSAEAPAAAPRAQKTRVVAMDAGGKLTLDETAVTPDALVEQLKAAAAAAPGEPSAVTLAVDPKTPMKQVTALMEAVAGAGAVVEGVSIGPDRPTPGAEADGLSDVHLDEAKVDSLVKYHERIVGPQEAALRQAAQAHYDVIRSLRREQQRLVTEADLIQRAIDRLEKRYADLTTPTPGDDGPGGVLEATDQ